MEKESEETAFLLSKLNNSTYPDSAFHGESNRLIGKGGSILVKRRFEGEGGLGHLKAYLWKDLFTSLVDAHWWRILVFGAVLYISLWFTFAVLYWNFDDESIPGCGKSQLSTFTDAFLLSIDSQSTIGFGNYAVDSSCWPGILILVIQCLVSTLVDASFVGLVFAKISRPQHRSNTLMFSRNACITDVGGERQLMIRVADQRKNLLVEAHARLLMYYTDYSHSDDDSREDDENGEGGERVWVRVEQLELESAEVFLLLPVLLIHRIGPSSPLYRMGGSKEMAARGVELVVLLEGTTSSTSQTMQARQSYLPEEVLWGRCFGPCCRIDDQGAVEVDFDHIDDTNASSPDS